MIQPFNITNMFYNIEIKEVQFCFSKDEGYEGSCICMLSKQLDLREALSYSGRILLDR